MNNIAEIGSFRVRYVAFPVLLLSLGALILFSVTVALPFLEPWSEILLCLLWCLLAVAWVLWGLPRWGISRESLIGSLPRPIDYTLILLMAPIYCLSACWSWILWYIQRYLAGIKPHLALLVTAGDTSPPAGVVQTIAACLVLVIAVPAVEETVFRRLVLMRLAQKWGITAGLLVSAVLWGIFHGPRAPLMILVGLVLGLVYLKSGSLLIPIGLHAAFNLVSFQHGWIPQIIELGAFWLFVLGGIPLAILIFRLWPRRVVTASGSDLSKSPVGD